MARTDCDWVMERFAAGASDWTPAPAIGAAQLLYAPLSRDPEFSRRCGSLLSEAELRRADRFLTGDARANFVQRRAFRRYCGALALQTPRALSDIVFGETEKGRPYLAGCPDISFSFSACRFGFLGAWSRSREIGVDLEDATGRAEAVELARRFFSQAEAGAVIAARGPARSRTFYRLWSLKEASLKSIGEGLPFGLEQFEFELSPELRVVRAPSQHVGAVLIDAHLIERDEICAALVMGGRRLPGSTAVAQEAMLECGSH